MAQAPSPPDSGTIRVGYLQRDGRYRQETLSLDDYVARVLAGEAARDSPPAALEALAITIRTYARANAGRHRADGFDMCDQTHCQVIGVATDATRAAAQATSGQVLMYDGRPADVYYSASCGGRTEQPSAVWPGANDPPYLPVQDDEACDGAPEWDVTIDADDLLRALRAAGFRGSRLAGLLVVAHDDSGRVSELVASGLQPSRISGQRLREAVSAALGPQFIRSTAFEVRRASSGYEFTGNGSGHGVGLCVIGSVNRAAAGESAGAILLRYFPGTTIESLAGGRPVTPAARPTAAPAAPSPAPGLRVSLPADQESERARVADLAAAARTDIAARLGVPEPPDIALRFHPTNQSFELATGQPWYVLSAIVAGEVHLAPIDWLEARGVLERAIRGAMTHVLADASLERRPAWVREGLAAYYADPDAGAPSAGGACPSDVDLVRPLSPGALSTAYQQAEACVARQLASGRSWRDIR